MIRPQPKPVSPLSRLHNIDAERAVLGSILIEGTEAFDRVAAVLLPEDFYLEKHRVIYRAMLGLRDQGSPIDLITVAEWLQRTGTMAFCGGHGVLALLVEFSSIYAHLMSYVKIVQEYGVSREVVQQATALISSIHEAQSFHDQVLRVRAMTWYLRSRGIDG